MIDLTLLNKYRAWRTERATYGENGGPIAGLFQIPSCTDGRLLRVIASCDAGWDHVSVSREKRCPNWPEMEQIKRMFFAPDETAFQLHVPESEHINIHPFCLHIWRPHATPIPMPPAWMVGPSVS